MENKIILDEGRQCMNFKECGNYTNAKHSKWCSPCSLIWQIRQMGYEPEFEIDDGEIQGLVLTRRDIFEKHQSSYKEVSNNQEKKP